MELGYIGADTEGCDPNELADKPTGGGPDGPYGFDPDIIGELCIAILGGPVDSGICGREQDSHTVISIQFSVQLGKQYKYYSMVHQLI